MMKTLLLLLAGGLFCLAAAGAETAPVLLANPLQGTDDPPNFSHGNEYPAVALPFPMNVWAPYTEPENNFLFYQYRHLQIRGLRQTREPSRWIGDYANFSLMPVSGRLAVTETERASAFRHEDEVAQPSYYKVRLDTWSATAEVTPTERAARLRFTFEKPGDAYVVLDVFGTKRISSVKIIPAENKIIGVARNYHGRAGLALPGGKTLVITARNNGPQQPYIQSARLNGKDFDQTFLRHESIAAGGRLEFQMDAAPNYHWGVGTNSRPASPLEVLLRNRGE